MKKKQYSNQLGIWLSDEQLALLNEAFVKELSSRSSDHQLLTRNEFVRLVLFSALEDKP